MGVVKNRLRGLARAIVLIAGLTLALVLARALASGPGGEPVAADEPWPNAHGTGAGPGTVTVPVPAFDPQRDYDQSQASDEARAHHGAIFVARVDALIGEEEEPSGGTAPPHHIQQYTATVEQTLAGDERGQIHLLYLGADEITPDSQGFGPLRIGERYLFFAGTTEDGSAYTVSAGTGAILITSEQHQKDLVEHYLPLIAEADAAEQAAIAEATAWAKAVESRAGVTPSVTIEPRQGPAGTKVVVSGKNFNFRETTIRYGSKKNYGMVAAADGSFRATITIPKNAPEGPLPIRVDDERDFSTEVTFLVTD